MNIFSKADFSEDRKYRYSLTRRWGLFSENYLLFIGLNPSTADEKQDDPTIRRCINFAKRMNYDGIVMLNIFAFRATDPKVMMKESDPVGKDNDKTILSYVKEGNVFVAAWGTLGRFLDRDKQVIKLVPNLKCLGITKEGFPKHPLYLKADCELIDYN